MPLPFQKLMATVKLDDPHRSASEGSPLTALAGGGQTGATPLIYGVNEVSVVASANDSVILPPAVGGKIVFVLNTSANPCQVFGDSGASDTVNGIASASGVSVAAGKIAMFIATQTANKNASIAGRWMMSYSSIGAGVNNFSATTDPGVSNDNTQGYSFGSIWYNNAAGYLRWWVCHDASTGAAKWVYEGADFANGGTNPNSDVTMAGSSSALMAAEGNINRQTSAAGVQPAATAGDYVLAVYSLPANFFDVAGRGLTISSIGAFGATVNNKRVKIIFNPSTAVVGSVVTGGTAIADTGTVATNGSGWSLQASVFKYGAAGSNTQLAIHSQAQVGAAVAALVAPTAVTAAENGAILIAVTGNATTATTDITFNWLEVNAMN